MADKKVLVTSGGVYAVKDGKTLPLEEGTEVSIDAEQADKLAQRGRVELVSNSKTEPKSKQIK